MLGYVLITLWHGLEHNHRVGENELLQDLGIGNLLTIIRGILVAGMTGFLLLPQPQGWLAWIPGCLYTISGLLDFLDGIIARLTNRSTKLGEMLDMSLDGVGVLVASVLVVKYGQVPFWFLMVGFARILFLFGIRLRKRLDKPVFELETSYNRRLFAGLEMGLLSVLLWPVFSPPGTALVAAVFSIPFLGGFLLDWFQVSGIHISFQITYNRYQELVKHHLALLLRIAIVCLMMGLILWGWRTTSTALRITEVLVIVMMSFGILSRFAAIIGLITLGFQQNLGGLLLTEMILIILDALVLYIGGGKFSLVKVEEYLVTHRIGER